jgi:hypothetical protein
MNLAVRHLRAIGCQASGIISDQELVQAMRAETRSHDYDEVILATGRQAGPGWRAACIGTRFISCDGAGGTGWSFSPPRRAPRRSNDSRSNGGAVARLPWPYLASRCAGKARRRRHGRTSSAQRTPP